MEKNAKNKTRKLVTLSALVAVAMILSYLESLIPPFIAVPGAKIGLSNIATVFALYTLGWQSAIAVSAVRVLLSALLFGNAVALLYSASGAVLALAFMILCYKLGIFSSVGVSVVGGVFHNAGQVIAAAFVMENAAISIYIAPLAVVGTIAGVAVGVAAGLLVKRLKKYTENF